MPKIQKDLSFIPSKSIQKLWLNTRKAEKIFGGVSLPGFYGTSGYTIDVFMFLIALFLEVLGIYNLMIVGEIAIIMATFLILLDIAAAFVAHMNVRNKLIQTSYAITTDDPREQNKYRQLANGYPKYLAMFGKLVIVSLALFKIAAFWGLVGVFNGITLFIVITYIIVAYIHIYYTGYFVYEFITSFIFNSQFKKFNREKRNDEVSEVLTHDIFSARELKEFNINNRKLVRNEAGDDKRGLCYLLSSDGIFDDEDLSTFVMQQKNENRAEFARQCLAFQLSIYGQSN